mgnify:CR=1 FL=1
MTFDSLAKEIKKAKEAEQEANKKEIGWGAQIRSYVLHPYKMVKDHRTNHEMGQAEKVLDGESLPKSSEIDEGLNLKNLFGFQPLPKM